MREDLVTNFNFPEGKTTVIHNPVEEISGAPIPIAKNKFITVARLSEEKGIDRLIRSAAKLTIPFQYFIIGEGDQREKLQKLIIDLQLGDKVFLTGEKINPYLGMEDAALMLSGSLYEGFPNSLLEAGMLGIPVVAFDAPGGIGEIIRSGENGLLVKDNDEAAFAITIEKASQTTFDRAKIITSTKERYTLYKVIAETERLFKQLHHAK
jgi:glycosyltransferase involved in cell wall biosynthesis